MNLRGIRTTAHTNVVLVAIMSVVIGVFIILAIRYLFHFQGWSGLISYRPFYDSSQFQVQALIAGTSFAALTYIGFDGITTLAEDVENPKRNVMLATVLVCIFTGLFSGLQIYLAQRVWPDYQSFPNLETAFMDVTRRVGGPLLFNALGAIMIVGGFGAAMGTQVGAARLLFGMGRDNVVPRKIFAYLDPRRNTPSYNIIFIALFAFVGAMTLTFEQGAEALNFGRLPLLHGGQPGGAVAVLHPAPTRTKAAILGRCFRARIGLPILPGHLAGLAHAGQGNWRGVVFARFRLPGFQDPRLPHRTRHDPFRRRVILRSLRRFKKVEKINQSDEPGLTAKDSAYFRRLRLELKSPVAEELSKKPFRAAAMRAGKGL